MCPGRARGPPGSARTCRPGDDVDRRPVPAGGGQLVPHLRGGDDDAPRDARQPPLDRREHVQRVGDRALRGDAVLGGVDVQDDRQPQRVVAQQAAQEVRRVVDGDQVGPLVPAEAPQPREVPPVAHHDVQGEQQELCPAGPVEAPAAADRAEDAAARPVHGDRPARAAHREAAVVQRAHGQPVLAGQVRRDHLRVPAEPGGDVRRVLVDDVGDPHRCASTASVSVVPVSARRYVLAAAVPTMATRMTLPSAKPPAPRSAPTGRRTWPGTPRRRACPRRGSRRGAARPAPRPSTGPRSTG